MADETAAFRHPWGFAVKVLWAMLGVSLPLLTTTGIELFEAGAVAEGKQTLNLVLRYGDGLG